MTHDHDQTPGDGDVGASTPHLEPTGVAGDGPLAPYPWSLPLDGPREASPLWESAVIADRRGLVFLAVVRLLTHGGLPSSAGRNARIAAGAAISGLGVVAAGHQLWWR